MAVLLPIHHRIFPVYRDERSREEVVVDRDLVEYGPAPTVASVQEQFDALRACTPANLSIYLSLPHTPTGQSGTLLHKMFEQRGRGNKSFANFAAVKVPQGWRVLQAPRHGGGDVVLDGVAPLTVRCPTTASPKAALYDSLLAAFVYGGGLIYPRPQGHGLMPSKLATDPIAARNHRIAAFILREDFLAVYRSAQHAPEDSATAWTPMRLREAKLPLPFLKERALVQQQYRSHGPELQLGLMRYMTQATLSVFMPYAAKDGLIFAKTHERLGAPRGYARNLAVAYTRRGWLPLDHLLDSWRTTAYQAAPTQIRVTLLQNREVHYFASLLEAYALGGGRVVGLPDQVLTAQKTYVAAQLDCYQLRYVNCMAQQSASTAAEWGSSFAVPWYRAQRAQTAGLLALQRGADATTALPMATPFAAHAWFGCAQTSAAPLQRSLPRTAPWAPYGFAFEHSGRADDRVGAEAVVMHRRFTIADVPGQRAPLLPIANRQSDVKQHNDNLRATAPPIKSEA